MRIDVGLNPTRAIRIYYFCLFSRNGLANTMDHSIYVLFFVLLSTTKTIVIIHSNVD